MTVDTVAVMALWACWAATYLGSFVRAVQYRYEEDVNMIEQAYRLLALSTMFGGLAVILR